MTEGRISRDRVEAIIAAYGADPEHWPEAEREGALELLEHYGEEQGQLQDSQALDALLREVARPMPTNMLRARLLEDASQVLTADHGLQRQNEPSAGTVWFRYFKELVFEPTGLRPLALGGIMAPVLAAGIWLGTSLTSEPLNEEELFAAFGEDYELWTDSELPDPSDMTGGS